MSKHVQNFSLKCKEVIGKILGGGKNGLLGEGGRFRKDSVGNAGRKWIDGGRGVGRG